MVLQYDEPEVELICLESCRGRCVTSACGDCHRETNPLEAGFPAPRWRGGES